MTSEDVLQEIERRPFVPLRMHLSSGDVITIADAETAWVRQNTLLIVHRIAPGTHAIGSYDVIALRLIERIESINGSSAAGKGKARRRKGK